MTTFLRGFPRNYLVSIGILVQRVYVEFCAVVEGVVESTLERTLWILLSRLGVDALLVEE